MIATALFLLALGFIGIAMSAKTIYEYGERVEMAATQYAKGWESNEPAPTAAKIESYQSQGMNYLTESIWKVRDDCIESAMVARSDKRHELFELLERAALLADEIRVRG